MDTFFEQIVPIKKTLGTFLAVVGIWLATALVCFFAFPYLFGLFGSFGVLIIFGLLFGVYKLACRFNVEYEYIITNGTLDVDKIINKSSRKRLLSLELSGVTRLEKYEPRLLASVDKRALSFACNKDDTNAYFLASEKDNSRSSYLVFSPDERLQGAILKFVPKYIANGAFK